MYRDSGSNGIQNEWHSNGQLRKELTYKNGEIHGQVSEWNVDGDIESVSFFKEEWEAYEAKQKKQ